MISVGLTGPIGSGKSTVLRVFREMGAETVDADVLAKDIMVKDSAIRQRLTETFGPETYQPDGSLNKPHLIREAFHKGRVDELNAIVHPAVKRETVRRIEEARRTGKALFVIEGALLLNRGKPDHLDKIILLVSRRKDQIERVKMRDQTTGEEILQRLDAQPDFERLQDLADVILRNNGTVEELQNQVKSLALQWLGDDG